MRNPADEQVAQMIEQAIKDDDHISNVAEDVHVTVKGDKVILDGKVRSEEEMNTVANTAMAIAAVDKVSNRLKVTHKRRR